MDERAEAPRVDPGTALMLRGTVAGALRGVVAVTAFSWVR